MTDDDLALCAERTSVAQAPVADRGLDERSQPKPLRALDAVNWLRYLAKGKLRLAKASHGTSEHTLFFQAHVMREAARHIEALVRDRGPASELPRRFETDVPRVGSKGVIADVKSGLGYD
jgi:hypothetical protein